MSEPGLTSGQKLLLGIFVPSILCLPVLFFIATSQFATPTDAFFQPGNNPLIQLFWSAIILGGISLFGLVCTVFLRIWAKKKRRRGGYYYTTW